jgi:hypothetical protein
MRSTADVSAEQFVQDYYVAFAAETVAAVDEPDVIVDRYYTPDVVQIADGIRLDRAQLIAHLEPMRKNLVSSRIEVHEAVRNADRVAARLTIHAELRKDRTLSTEVYLFAEFSPDGRLRRANQATRPAEGQA